MVSRTKRSSYVMESDSSSGEDMGYYPTYKHGKLSLHNNNFSANSKVKEEYLQETSSGEMRKMKCTTKNAVMARQNRKRKKMYIQNLEDEVSKLREEKGKLSSILDNQSFVISELRKEIKYMKSILANSADIGNLIKNIRCSTGMSVTTSLDKSLTLNNDCVSKHTPNIARKTAHPWEDRSVEIHHNISIPEESLPSLTDASGDFDISNTLFDLNLPLDMGSSLPDIRFDLSENEDSPITFETLEDKSYQNNNSTVFHTTLNEHNYTNIFASEARVNRDDVGVCLHVSKHRVSLEFCPSCSENAHQTWKTLE